MVSRKTVRLIGLGLFASILLGTAFAPGLGVHAKSHSTTKSRFKLSYTKDGDLVPPLQYRRWIYLTSGIDMSYLPKASSKDEGSTFDNVFVNPEAYQVFSQTGAWPDKTVLVLEARHASSKGSINQNGHFQSGGVVGLELHVKDEARFPGKWAFFDVANEAKATQIPSGAPCYSCHTEHGAVDTTFVQFYPTLLPTAQSKGTLSVNYLKDTQVNTPH